MQGELPEGLPQLKARGLHRQATGEGSHRFAAGKEGARTGLAVGS